jgi:hypothetical protein
MQRKTQLDTEAPTFPRDARVPRDMAALERCPMLTTLVHLQLDRKAKAERTGWLAQLIATTLKGK